MADNTATEGNSGTPAGGTPAAAAVVDPKVAAAGQTGAEGGTGAAGGTTGTEAKAPATALTEGEPAKPVAPPTFPENWREEMAKAIGGTDQAAIDKELKRLKMFGSPNDVYKSQRELEGKLSRGEFKAPLAKDATPEQIATWREQNGIPATPDKYDLTLNDGLVIGEQDKPFVDKFVQQLHGENATPAQVKAALNTYYEMVQGLTAQRLESYETARDTAVAELQKEWGDEYKRNVNLIQGTLTATFGDSAKHILEGFGSDGIPLMSNPAVIKAFAALSRQVNPAGMLDLPAGANQLQSIETELATLEKKMGDNNSDYWKGPTAARNQERYRELVAGQQVLKKRA